MIDCGLSVWELSSLCIVSLNAHDTCVGVADVPTVLIVRWLVRVGAVTPPRHLIFLIEDTWVGSAMSLP